MKIPQPALTDSPTHLLQPFPPTTVFHASAHNSATYSYLSVKVHEMIIISLFDEVVFDDRRSGGYLDDETAIRREKRFLGSVVLPFQVIRF